MASSVIANAVANTPATRNNNALLRSSSTESRGLPKSGRAVVLIGAVVELESTDSAVGMRVSPESVGRLLTLEVIRTLPVTLMLPPEFASPAGLAPLDPSPSDLRSPIGAESISVSKSSVSKKRRSNFDDLWYARLFEGRSMLG